MTRGYVIITGPKNKIERIGYLSNSAYPSYYGESIVTAIHEGTLERFMNDLDAESPDEKLDIELPIKEYVEAGNYTYVYDPGKDALKCYEYGKLSCEGAPKADYEFMVYVMNNYNAIRNLVTLDNDTMQMLPFKASALHKKLNESTLPVLKLELERLPNICWEERAPWNVDSFGAKPKKEIVVWGRPPKDDETEQDYSLELVRFDVCQYESIGAYIVSASKRVSGVDERQRTLELYSKKLFLRYIPGYIPGASVYGSRDRGISLTKATGAVKQFIIDHAEDFERLMMATICLRERANAIKSVKTEAQLKVLDTKFRKEVAPYFEKMSADAKVIFPYLDTNKSEFFYTIAFLTKRRPDTSISVSEMKKYGYTWGGMLPMREKAAMAAMKTCAVYCLYNDNTESRALNADELHAHAAKGGIFGVEKEEWARALA